MQQTKASLVNMQLTGLKSGRPASLWTGSVWGYWVDSYRAASGCLLHIFLWPTAPVARSEFHPPSMKHQIRLINRKTTASRCSTYIYIYIVVKSCITCESSIRKPSKSSSVRSEGEHPFSVTLEEKLRDDEAPPKPLRINIRQMLFISK